jgi:hypothetical protein
MQMGNVGEARQIAERLVNTAKSPQDRANAEMLLANIGQYQRYQEEQKKAEEQARAETEEFKRQLAEARKRVTERAQEEQPPQPGTPAGQPAPATKGKPGWSTGKIVAVSCKAAPALELTLQGTLSKLRLHAAITSRLSSSPQAGNRLIPSTPASTSRVTWRPFPTAVSKVQPTTVRLSPLRSGSNLPGALPAAQG